MDGTPGLRLGDLFSGWDGLDVVTRRRLAERLALPGRPPPLLPGELAAAALPRRADDLASLRAIVEDGLGPDALVPFAEKQFAVVVPAIRGHGGAIASAPCPARLRGLLQRNHVTTWSELGALTLADIQAWTDAGPVTLVRLVRRAIDAGVASLAEATPGWPEDGPVEMAGGSGAGNGDLAILLAHELTTGADLLQRTLARFADDDYPDAVRAAAARLREAPAQPPEPGLEFLTRLLEAAGDERDRLVFEHLALAPHGSITTADVRAALGLSVERVRQIRTRAEDRVRCATEQLADHLPGLEALAGRLGSAAPLTSASDALVSLGLPALPDSRSLLALWLAGPYRPVADHPGWIATDPAELRDETRRMLDEDGGVRLADQVAKELDILGVIPELVAHWLGEQPVRRVAELLVATSGSSTDVAERALSALGRPMTVDELTEWISAGRPGQGAGGLWPLLSSDDRFVRVSADAFELAEWGSTAFERFPSLFPGAEDAASWAWLAVEVDAALLSGGSGVVPEPLIHQLGMRVGGHRTFATRYGPVTLSYDVNGPTRSRLRHVALAAGAEIGDQILVGFHCDSGDAHVERVPGKPSAR
jgi:hypothetical protein